MTKTVGPTTNSIILMVTYSSSIGNLPSTVTVMDTEIILVKIAVSLNTIQLSLMETCSHSIHRNTKTRMEMAGVTIHQTLFKVIIVSLTGALLGVTETDVLIRILMVLQTLGTMLECNGLLKMEPMYGRLTVPNGLTLMVMAMVITVLKMQPIQIVIQTTLQRQKITIQMDTLTDGPSFTI